MQNYLNWDNINTMIILIVSHIRRGKSHADAMFYWSQNGRLLSVEEWVQVLKGVEKQVPVPDQYADQEQIRLAKLYVEDKITEAEYNREAAEIRKAIAEGRIKG